MEQGGAEDPFGNRHSLEHLLQLSVHSFKKLKQVWIYGWYSSLGELPFDAICHILEAGGIEILLEYLLPIGSFHVKI
jgi:hypothetical protein